MTQPLLETRILRKNRYFLFVCILIPDNFRFPPICPSKHFSIDISRILDPMFSFDLESTYRFIVRMQSFWILNTVIIQLSKFSLDLCIFDGLLIILDSRDPKFSFDCELIYCFIIRMQSFWILNTGIIQLSKFSLDLCIFDGFF